MKYYEFVTKAGLAFDLSQLLTHLNHNDGIDEDAFHEHVTSVIGPLESSLATLKQFIQSPAFK